MDILFEIFQLKEPDWTDDFHLALLSVGKIEEPHNSFQVFKHFSQLKI